MPTKLVFHSLLKPNKKRVADLRGDGGSASGNSFGTALRPVADRP